jgi:hypothetical protein
MEMKQNKRQSRDIFTGYTAKQTLSVQGHFIGAEVSKGDSPLEIYAPKKSRFSFSVKSVDKEWVSGNISMQEIAEVFEATKSVYAIHTWAKLPVLNQIFTGIREINNKCHKIQMAFKILYTFVRTGRVLKLEDLKDSPEEECLAKSVMIQNGKLKGKTPYQILTEDPQAIVDLQSQYAWLKKNQGAFPQNTIQMKAIEEAICLNEEGELEKGMAKKLMFGSVPLYKAVPKPQRHKKDENGYVPVYELGINWHIGDKYPVEIRVKNYKALVVKQESGVENPNRVDAIEKRSESFRLSTKDWLACVRLMESNMVRFENMIATSQFSELAALEENK